jgi:Fibronectin type III domain
VRKTLFIILFSTFLIITLDNQQIFAAPGGYFDGKAVPTTSGGTTTVITDNNAGTGDGLRYGPNPVLYFTENVNIRKIYIIADKTSDAAVSFYSDDAGTKLIRSITFDKFTYGVWNDISVDNVKKITFHKTSVNSNNPAIKEFDVITEQMISYLEPVNNLTVTKITDSSVALHWDNPSSENFIGVELYKNGKMISSLSKEKTEYQITGLESNTEYTFEIYAVYTPGIRSVAVLKTVKTLEEIPIVEIINLKADAKYDRVKLSWTLPESEFFSHVNIYRKKVEEKSFFYRLFGASSVSATTTSDGYTPMFETNGTYWTDLTVDPETTYSYKVTSENIEGKESNGVTIEVTTPSEPLPTMDGVSTTQNESGDYVVTWTSPTIGRVKVLINGKEYATVDAATQKIVIPKEDMRLNFFGGYDAKLVPISERGTEGKPVQVPVVGETKVDLPFSFDEFMQTVISILAWAAPFILLSLVLIFWRPFIEFLRKTILAKGGRVKQ